MTQRFWLAISCSLWGGLSIGVFEAFSLLLGVGAGEYDALFFAGLGYGMLGVMLSLLWSWIVAVPFFTRVSKFWLWSIGFWSTFSLLAYWIFQPSLLWIFLLPTLIWFQQIILQRTPLKVILTPKGTLFLFSIILLVLGVFSLTPSRNIYAPPAHVELAGQRPNILIILVDGLRKIDGTHPNMPALKALQQQGITFENAFANAPTRYHSIAQLFSGQSVHQQPPLQEEYMTLAEHLSWHGYHSIALMNDSDLGRFSNLHQGFDLYRYLPPLVQSHRWGGFHMNEGTRKLRLFNWLFHQVNPAQSSPSQFYRSAADMVQHLERELLNVPEGRPWFAVVHFRDTQWPLFMGDAAQRQMIHAHMPLHNQQQAYEQALGNIDHSLSKLWAFLKNQQQYNQTIVVLTAPFQIQLMPSNSSAYPHPQQLSIPLLLKVPSIPPKVIRNNVQLMDVPQTLISLVNLPNVATWQGQNMFRLPPIGDNRAIVGSYQPKGAPTKWLSVQQGNWRYIRWNGAEGLYNVEEDPMFEHNQMQNHPQEYQQILEEIHFYEQRGDE